MVFNSLFCDDKEAYFILFFGVLILPDLEQKKSKNVIIFLKIWYAVTISTGTLLVYKKDAGMQVKLPRFPNSLSVPRNHYQSNKKTSERVELDQLYKSACSGTLPWLFRT